MWLCSYIPIPSSPPGYSENLVTSISYIKPSLMEDHSVPWLNRNVVRCSEGGGEQELCNSALRARGTMGIFSNSSFIKPFRTP